MTTLGRKREKESEHVTHTEEETFDLARRLAAGFKGEEIVLLTGELGAGKTVFAKGIAAGLGIDDVHQVCSPSFTLVNIYQARCPIYHVDLYRLGKDAEMLDLGWEDFIGSGVIVVEWAEKLNFELGESIQVFIEMGKNDERIIRIIQ